MDSTGAFRAFVSYCHADAAFASWLQRRLEGYRLPRRLADRVAPLSGQSQGRIGPVFRDRADLSAAEDLSSAVREAIARSSSLIVVASPDAVRSQWVTREIELFRELHPNAPILVALARGEPGDALPQALRTDGVEPLAADFRPEGDGKRLAFLKIVAGLAGLPLDALVQRDAQRQVRRVTAVTLGAAVLVVIMAGLLVVALRARAEAEQQRAGAEGLVEFMLTTLREELKGAGRPQVMTKVDARAMEYYSDRGDLGLLSDASLERRARVLHAMGEDDDQRGDLDLALTKYTEAYRTTAAILARRPIDGDAIYAHAQSEFWVGNAAWLKGDRLIATRHWQGYLVQANALAKAEQGSVRSLIEQGYAEGNLCDLDYHDSHDLSAAARHCLAAVRYFEAARGKVPTDRKTMQDLANRFGWLARVQLARKDYAGSTGSREAELVLMDRLVAVDPDNAEYLKRRSWPDIGMATIWIETNQPARAAELLQHRWSAFAPRLVPGQSVEIWDTGMRMLLFLSKAQRLAKSTSYQGTSARVGDYVQRYVRLFPERASQIEKLRNDIG
ncbi:MAG: hypothetical protein JWN66_717 [Sphingomonas bacterium]|uniref:toll/interleukin-1 receptor domain-containing protein n=1 Tax=Sphingomonas bacterium TaxID=1895847 RepID=UPI002626C9F3|nr:toll/interleukin-1 receptor domain-containing protein [Sphingomonas bacterium]MDB5703601.1 hypothetical protein [Sphingomonas bacterium]